jgi:hypothetical protein
VDIDGVNSFRQASPAKQYGDHMCRRPASPASGTPIDDRNYSTLAGAPSDVSLSPAAV